MNMNGQGHLLTLVQGHSDSTFSSFFSLETTRPIEAKFHVDPSWDEGVKVNTLCFVSHDQDGRHTHIW